MKKMQSQESQEHRETVCCSLVQERDKTPRRSLKLGPWARPDRSPMTQMTPHAATELRLRFRVNLRLGLGLG